MYDSLSDESDLADVTGRGRSDSTFLGEVLVCIKHFDSLKMTLILELVSGTGSVRDMSLSKMLGPNIRICVSINTAYGADRDSPLQGRAPVMAVFGAILMRVRRSLG